ncbi:MAG: acireductone dioxygenase, partial [Nannocystaceae bacterium]|nr:acireductone dioxygenase [Nannocystaceae bacterium]
MKLQWLEPNDPQESISHADLAAVGVLAERLELDSDAFQPALDQLKARRGYVEQDIIELQPETCLLYTS